MKYKRVNAIETPHAKCIGCKRKLRLTLLYHIEVKLKDKVFPVGGNDFCPKCYDSLTLVPSKDCST